MTCLLTWSCYAINITPHSCEPLRQWRCAHCRYPPYELDCRDRREVLEAILEHARRGEYRLLAVHVRSTHVHVLATHVTDPYRLCASLKACTTRRLRQQRGLPPDRPVWADFRNVRRLRTREAILKALAYVVEKQGAPMALWHVPHDFPLP